MQFILLRAHGFDDAMQAIDIEFLIDKATECDSTQHIETVAAIPGTQLNRLVCAIAL